jgi:hypothetical protein
MTSAGLIQASREILVWCKGMLHPVKACHGMQSVAAHELQAKVWEKGCSHLHQRHALGYEPWLAHYKGCSEWQ